MARRNSIWRSPPTIWVQWHRDPCLKRVPPRPKDSFFEPAPEAILWRDLSSQLTAVLSAARRNRSVGPDGPPEKQAQPEPYSVWALRPAARACNHRRLRFLTTLETGTHQMPSECVRGHGGFTGSWKPAVVPLRALRPGRRLCGPLGGPPGGFRAGPVELRRVVGRALEYPHGPRLAGCAPEGLSQRATRDA